MIAIENNKIDLRYKSKDGVYNSVRDRLTNMKAQYAECSTVKDLYSRLSFNDIVSDWTTKRYSPYEPVVSWIMSYTANRETINDKSTIFNSHRIAYMLDELDELSIVVKSYLSSPILCDGRATNNLHGILSDITQSKLFKNCSSYKCKAKPNTLEVNIYIYSETYWVDKDSIYAYNDIMLKTINECLS